MARCVSSAWSSSRWARRRIRLPCCSGRTSSGTARSASGRCTSGRGARIRADCTRTGIRRCPASTRRTWWRWRTTKQRRAASGEPVSGFRFSVVRESHPREDLPTLVEDEPLVQVAEHERFGGIVDDVDVARLDEDDASGRARLQAIDARGALAEALVVDEVHVDGIAGGEPETEAEAM